MNNQKKKKLIRNLIIWGIVILLLAAFAFVLYKIYSKTDVNNYGDEPVVVEKTDDGKAQYTMKNDHLEFVMDAETSHFTVKDLQSGKVWRSNPEGIEKDLQSGVKNKEAFGATLLLTYQKGIQTEKEYNNYSYSIMNGFFNITQPEDNLIEVEYSIGDIEPHYMIPTAISEARFKEFSAKLSKKDAKVVSSCYSKKTMSKATDEEKAAYPGLENGDLYILKSDTKKKAKQQLDGLFVSAGYTAEEQAIDDLNLAVVESSKTSDILFNVTIEYRLDNETGDLIVSVPYEKMHCNASAPIVALSVLPMFGAADEKAEGYLFVPEGGGAVINYNNKKTTLATYQTNVYGMDYAQIQDEGKTENRTSLPVFGSARTKDDASFICVIEEADGFASIVADVAGKSNSYYNTVAAKYKVVHYDKYNITGSSTDPFYMYEKAIPKSTIVQRYRFINSSSYVDMAVSFRDYLEKKYADVMVSTASEEMPVNVELVGAINKVVVKAGLPVDSVVATTTFEQAGAIIDELTEANVKNLSVRMTGWANDGIYQTVLTSVKTVGALGGDKELEKLTAHAKDKNVSLYLDGITCFAYDSGVFDGFIATSHAARYTTRETVKLYPFDVITFRQADWMKIRYYLVHPSYAVKCAANLIEAAKQHNAGGVAFRDIGKLLGSDYDASNIVTREEVKALNIETLKKANEEGLKVSVKAGNLYAIPYANIVTDMDLAGNDYTLLDGHVPFYQIAIHGMIDYTGEAINIGSNYRKLFLNCVEYGAGLNFTFMKEETRILQDTAYSCYTSAGYDQWSKEVIEMITDYQKAMEGLNQKKIVSHERLSKNVTVTGYADDALATDVICIYVNYGTTPYTVEGSDIVVPANGYVRAQKSVAPVETETVEATEQKGGNEE